jgi:hypothetical protein
MLATLLVILFFYQRNRNKVLEDHLASQRQLINEAKSVVAQQSSALEGQEKVVHAALKYSSAFDSKKLEDVVRREVDIEHREEIDRLKREIEAKAAAPASQIVTLDSMLDNLIAAVVTSAAEACEDMISPLIPHVFRSLLSTPESERATAIVEVRPVGLQQTLLDAVATIESRIHAAREDEV